jgi:acetyl-CoA carboxylase biotin carboxyl carrier protein
MSHSIVSEVAGTVWLIVAREGDELARGDQILVIESMKMEMGVEAPSKGRLTSLKVAEGDIVSEGQELGTMELDR